MLLFGIELEQFVANVHFQNYIGRKFFSLLSDLPKDITVKYGSKNSVETFRKMEGVLES